MTPRLRAFAAVAALLAVSALAAGVRAEKAQTQDASPQRPTFRAATDIVRVDVSVRDGRRGVTGLTAADFAVTDNGVPQRVVDVSYGRLPIDVTVALDVSYSVTGALLDQLRTAVRQLMSDLGPDDRLKLVSFNMRVTRVVDLTGDAGAVEQAIGQVAAGGGSSIWDAAAVSLVSASAATADRRQLVVLFTDGADSTSLATPDSVADVAQRTNASVTAVLPDGLFPAQGRVVVARRSPLAPFQRLAAETGGTVLASGSNLTSTFRRALEEFRSSYVLHFTPQGVPPAGFHALTVSVPRDRGFTIRARRGYFGG